MSPFARPIARRRGAVVVGWLDWEEGREVWEKAMAFMVDGG